MVDSRKKVHLAVNRPDWCVGVGGGGGAQTSRFSSGPRARSTDLLTTPWLPQRLGAGTFRLASLGLRLWVLLGGSQEAPSRVLLMERAVKRG